MSQADNDGDRPAPVSSTDSMFQSNVTVEPPQLSQPSSRDETPNGSKTRPTDTKRAIESAKQMLALHKGAMAIEKRQRLPVSVGKSRKKCYHWTIKSS